ncbi:hypothetical protein KLAE6086_12990 [Klebsiella aerogenes]
MFKKTTLEEGVERDELADNRLAFMAGEVGGVFELIYNGIEINKENIVGFLEGKRKAVGNVIHKGLLRDAAEVVRKVKTRRGGRVIGNSITACQPSCR